MKHSAVAGFGEKGQKDKSSFHFCFKKKKRKKRKSAGAEKEVKGKARAVPGFSLFKSGFIAAV